jgi:hypothetical protein
MAGAARLLLGYAAPNSERIVTDRRSVDELKELGSGKPATGELARLYEQAFREFGALALWSSRKTRRLPWPTFWP